MKNFLKIILFSTLICSTFNSFSQENYEVPRKYELKEKEDYVKYEKDIVATLNWLIETPADVSPTKRKKANSFLIQWAEGSEYTFTISEFVTEFGSDYMVIFIGGWAKYCIETKDKNALNGNLAGINTVIKYYSKNKDFFDHNEVIEKMISLKAKGRLAKKIKKIIK